MDRHEWMQWEERRMRVELLDVAQTNGLESARAAQETIAVLERASTQRADESAGLRGELASLREAQGLAHATQEAGNRQLEATMQRGFSELGDRLSTKLDAIDAALSNIGDLIESGFTEVASLLTQISTKLEWSEQYKRFLRFKKEAFEMAQHGDYPRAIRQGLAAITIRDDRGAAEDQIERDPLLCAFLARALMSVDLPDYSGPAPTELARRAFDRGQIVGGATGSQAAAEGARVLAIWHRAVGDWNGALAWERFSYDLEQTDAQSATAGLLACGAVTNRSEAVVELVAAYAVIYPGFLPGWLINPALTMRPGEASAAILEVGAVLRDHQRAAVAARENHVRFWTGRLAQAGDHERLVQRAFGKHVGTAPTTMALTAVAGRIRDQYQAIQKGDEEVRKYLVEHSGKLLQRVNERSTALAAGLKETFERDSAARTYEADDLSRVLPETSKRLEFWSYAVLLGGAGCGGLLVARTLLWAVAFPLPAGVQVMFFGCPLVLWLVCLAACRSVQGAVTAARERLEDAQRKAAEAEQRYQAEVAAAIRLRDALRRDLQDVARSVGTLGHPPFIDGPSYEAIIAGLQGQRMAPEDKPLTSEQVWSGFEDVRAAGRGPVVDAIVAVWCRATAL